MMGFFSLRRSNSNKRLSTDERARARRSVAHAKTNFSKARTEARQEANEYARKEDGELEKQGKLSHIGQSPAWYTFWQKPNKLPKELEMWNGNTVSWETASANCKTEIVDAAEDNAGQWSDAKKIFWLSDMKCESKSANGLLYIRVRASLKVPPKALLLTQIRAELRGKSDNSLVYLREHYKFRFGKSLLFHSIVDPPAKMSSPRDFCDLVSWQEYPDGKIVVAEQSVMNCMPKKSVRSCVRGVTRVRGMLMTPAKVQVNNLLGGSSVVDGTDVTYIMCVDPKGWLPKGLFNMSLRKQVGQFLLNCEAVGMSVVKDGSADFLVRKFVQLQADDSEDEDGDDGADDGEYDEEEVQDGENTQPEVQA